MMFYHCLQFFQAYGEVGIVLNGPENHRLGNIIIPVSIIRIDIGRDKKPQTLIQAQRGNGGFVQFGHLPDSELIVFHRVYLSCLSSPGGRSGR